LYLYYIIPRSENACWQGHFREAVNAAGARSAQAAKQAFRKYYTTEVVIFNTFILHLKIVAFLFFIKKCIIWLAVQGYFFFMNFFDVLSNI